jgi:hypothetical protein
MAVLSSRGAIICHRIALPDAEPPSMDSTSVVD